MQLYDNQALFSSLSELEVIPKDKLQKAFEESKHSQKPLGEILLNKELIADENLGKVIASSIKTPFVNLSKIHITDDLLLVVPEVLARKSHLIAFERSKNGIKLAMANPKDNELVKLISKKTGEKIIAYFATTRDINGALAHYQKEMQKTFNELLNQQVEEAQKSKVKEAPISKIVDLLIEYAYQNKTGEENA